MPVTQPMLIAETPHFEVLRFYAHNSLRNYTYVLLETATRHGWVIDPWDGEVVWQWAQDAQVILSGILNTHQHHDHIKGNAYLAEQGVPVLDQFETVAPGVGEKATWCSPGHTMEHVVFFLNDGGKRHCFMGDTLFQAGVGNCKHGGDPATLFHTLQQLAQQLTPDTWLHTGHDYLERNGQFALHVEPSNKSVQRLVAGLSESPPTFERPPHQWQDELAINPFLRLNQPELHLATSADNDEMVFKVLRLMRDSW